MKQQILKNINKRKKYHYQFKEIFNIELSNFFDNITGFDIIKFDEWLDTPDGKSCSDFITEKYGINATKMIEDLI